MLWLILALTAYFFWSWVNIGDKYLIGNKIKDPYVYTVVGFLAGVVSLSVLPFIDFYVPSPAIIAWLALAALGFIGGTFLYVKSTQTEEITRVSILLNFLPVFSFLIAWLTIGEKLTSIQLVAFALLVAGAFIASLHYQSRTRRLLPSLRAVVLMTTACFLYAGHDVIVRYLLRSIPFSLAFVYLGFFVTLFSLAAFMFAGFRKKWAGERPSYSGKVVLLVVAITVISRAGLLLHTQAVSLKPVALINALEGFQMIFVFLISVAVSYLAPAVLREKWDKGNALLKLAALVLMLAGILLLNLA